LCGDALLQIIAGAKSSRLKSGRNYLIPIKGYENAFSSRRFSFLWIWRPAGDGFASGFSFGLLAGEEPQDAVNLGWAHGALLTTFHGDTTMATLEQVRDFAQGGSARIQRSVNLFRPEADQFINLT